MCTCQQMQTPASFRSHPPTHTGAVYPGGGSDGGPCRPMSVLRERKYFVIARVSFCVNNLIRRWAEIGRSQEACSGRGGGGSGIGRSSVSGTR